MLYLQSAWNVVLKSVCWMNKNETAVDSQIVSIEREHRMGAKAFLLKNIFLIGK